MSGARRAAMPWPADAAASALVDRVAGAATLLVALDFDGTLAPRVDDPLDARMVPEARAALDALHEVDGVELALVSGRSITDLLVISELDTPAPWHLSGSHGAEVLFAGTTSIVGAPSAAEAALRDELRAEAERLTAELRGIWIEPKTFGFGVHSRTAGADAAARAASEVAALMASRAPAWRRRTGHDLVEYSFRETGKDTALESLRARLAPDAVLFAGDDVTDEDGLAALEGGDLGIRVGPGDTHAQLRVEAPETLAALLAELARARRAAGAQYTL